MPGGTPTKANLAKRQSVVTQVITASASAAPSAAPKKAFPIAVAVPALVGGMALAIAAFLLYWWIAKRRRREKRLRWERHQAFLAKKRNQTPRPSVSTQRANSGQSSSSAKSPINEKKELIPPVPALHKHANQNQNQNQYAFGKPEQGYGYSHQEHYGQNQPQQYQQYEQAYHNYAPQPTQMDHYRGDQTEHGATAAAAQQYTYADPQPQHAPVTLEKPIAEPEPAPTAEPSRPAKSSSRSAARVAAAEKAAEASHGDINTRYQPKKPSPLAVKAAAERQQQQEQQQQQQQYLSADPYAASAGRQVSGEWGVALGSPTHDAGFAQQQVHGQRESYSNDPYLVQNQARGKSGMYSHDPYAAYHGDEVEEVDYHQVAADMEGKKRSNWV